MVFVDVLSGWLGLSSGVFMRFFIMDLPCTPPQCPVMEEGGLFCAVFGLGRSKRRGCRACKAG